MAERGFDQPVFEAQRVFRTLLTALSEPGRVLALSSGCLPPAGLDPAAAAVALALCDGDTPLWLDAGARAAASYLRFHTGAPIVRAPSDALFLLASLPHRPPLALLSPGTPEYPDRSATLILAAEGLAEGEGWTLSGPGIAGTRRLAVAGIDERFAGEWRWNRARFPLGVDVVFAARERIAALPRGTRLEG
ncbi:MAG TPA: phosphonate C-P lyase system protein PhnH [Stellaceae bacterium]|nr:phosphonate C-P lyase system protein PhnH [Stellaceae bacterium]